MKDFQALAEADILAISKKGANIGYLGLALKSVKKILMSNDLSGRPMFESVMDCKRTLIPTRGNKYFHESLSQFKYKNGSLIYILGTDQSMELGTSMDMLVVTESARIPFDAWKFLVPTIEGADGIILHVSTPYYGSEFNDLVDGLHPLAFADDDKTDPVYEVIKVPATELYNADGSRVYTDEKLARIRSQMDDATFRQE